MKMGTKRLRPSLTLLVLSLVAFFFGRLSTSLNQQFCFTNSWRSPLTGAHLVTKSHTEASSIVQEDAAAAQLHITVEQKTVRDVGEPVNPPWPSAERESLHTTTNTGMLCRSPTLADKLPQTFIHKTSDLNLHRLTGNPDEDIQNAPKNLLAMAVGIKQNVTVGAIVKKFPKEHFQIMLFHYDDVVDKWKQFEWYHKSIRNYDGLGQSKWWFAKRYLHPDIVAPYENIFVWDEDLGVENFDPIKFIDIMKRHELQISQPAIEGNISWGITGRRNYTKDYPEVHKHNDWNDANNNCSLNQFEPPCAGFVEIQVPVFVNKAWNCVWYLIQNDLVTGWGLDFQLHTCIDGAPHEHIGVVDSQWIVHKQIPSLGSEGAHANNTQRLRGEVIARSKLEQEENNKRWIESLASQNKEFSSQN